MIIDVAAAMAVIQAGGVVAIPTETVYGLAASASSEAGVAKIFALKSRPQTNPLIVHVSDAVTCFDACEHLPPHLEQLVRTFWPGPLTVVVPVVAEAFSPLIRANLPTCAFRCPNHALTQELIAAVGPLVAPSANISGKPSATHHDHIAHDFGPHFPVLGGGKTAQGVESTILIYSKDRWYLGRHGALPVAAIEAVLGYTLEMKQSDVPLCPGQLFRHYAPNAHLCLTKAPKGDCIVGFTDRVYPPSSRLFFLGDSTKPHEVAKNIYHCLRQLDKENIREAEVDINVPTDGLWSTILERLNRASSR